MSNEMRLLIIASAFLIYVLYVDRVSSGDDDAKALWVTTTRSLTRVSGGCSSALDTSFHRGLRRASWTA